MQPQRYSTEASSSEVHLGLEALTICPKKNQTEKHCNSCMMTSIVVSSAASSLIGDYIGMESCFDLDKNEAICVGDSDVKDSHEYYSGVCNQSSGQREQCCRRRKMKREFPPPIPSLARTDNLPSHMPWVLKRYYTSDGRLILKEEKVRHHEYFWAHRSNGRLTLHLVPLDDIDEIYDIEDHVSDHEEAKEEEAQVNDFDSNNINNNADDDHKSNIVETLLKENTDPVIEDSMVKCSITETPTDNGTAPSLNYNSVRASPTCFLGLPVPAIRPVHI
ncbi:uncharacterized protein LOC111299807 [Durio zibethinus]|uniref:Uncharacterized protein LOC111299807 n=1 Tax=Durio zibethinus TaxID=66656 RepID=A0A6P5ZF75_DURZI|nr:uncharacterized protein LOC111299807 [Durio zibethinus]